MTGLRPLSRRRLALGGLAIAGLLALSGCSAGMRGVDTVALDSAAYPAAAPEFSGSDGGASRELLAMDRAVITTGWATILVEDPTTAASEAAKIAERAGGRVEASSSNAPSEYFGGSASVTLRVPSAKLPAVLDELSALGTLQQSSTNSQDVTMQVTDLAARIGALESAVERLTELLAEADSTDALIQIETAMTDRQAELDSLRAQQRQLTEQVAMSSLAVDFQTEPTVGKTGPDDFLAGIVAGWEALAAFGAGLLIVAGVLLPWLVPIAIVVLVVWLIVRAVRRRRPADPAASEMATPTAPAPLVAPAAPPARDASGWPVVPRDDIDGKDA